MMVLMNIYLIALVIVDVNTHVVEDAALNEQLAKIPHFSPLMLHLTL